MKTEMDVFLLSHSQLSKKMRERIGDVPYTFTDGQAISLVSTRTCYSALDPKDILVEEGDKYFGRPATDGEGGNEADRLMRHIFSSKHLSVTEHSVFTFIVTGVSRALLAQITRHRHMSFSVQSQRYVRLGSGDKSGGADFVVPEKIAANEEALYVWQSQMLDIQQTYDRLRKLGVAPEDARSVLPNATATNMVLTANLRALLDFYGKRRPGRGGQLEITQLAEKLRSEVVDVEPWLDGFFDKT